MSLLVSFTQWDTVTLSGCHSAYDKAKEAAFRSHLQCGPGLVNGKPTTPRRSLDPAWTVSQAGMHPTDHRTVPEAEQQGLVSYLNQGMAVHCRGRPLEMR